MYWLKPLTSQSASSAFPSILFYPIIILLGIVSPPPALTSAERILFLLPIASKSHVHVFEPLTRSLAQKGHDVVSVSPVKYSDMPGNVQQVQILTTEDIFSHLGNPFEMREMGWLKLSLNGSITHLLTKCGDVLKSPQFQELLNDTFDLVIVDILMSYCAAGGIPVWKAPSILVTCYPAPALLLNSIGNRLLPSFIVDPMLSLPHHMNFFQRVGNTLFGVLMYFGSLYGFVYPSENLYRQHLPNGDSLPSLLSIQENASLIFSNSHWSMNHPRPLLPDVIEVGGMHTRPAKPLPKDIADFVNGSGEDGFIFFSLGSIVKGNAMPEKYRQIFLNVFSKLKQRVVWKWEDDSLQDLTSPNVLTRKWLPQQDILGHPKIKLFLSHGGILSTQEAVYHGVPMLALPIWGDQDLNSKRVEAAGLARIFEILTMTEESLEQAIQEMLQSPTYAQKAKEISKIFRDLPQTPLENAVFWSEYILRHRGAPHLKSYSRQLNFFQYYLLDVISFIVIVTVITLILIRSLCKRVCCRSCRRGNDKNLKYKMQ